LFRSQDFFGFEFKLQYDKKGGSHNTAAGGILSVIIKTFLFANVVYLSKLVWLYERDSNVTVTNKNHDSNDLASYKYSEAGFLYYFEIYHSIDDEDLEIDDETLNRHLRISASLVSAKFKSYPYRFDKTPIDIERCSKETK
jgi:hypothetical protein